MNKQIKFTYLAQAQPKNDPGGKDFEQVWAECHGKYPYQVIAIDGTVNKNGWGVKAERLKEFADRMKGMQVRVNHADDFMAIAGEVVDTEYDPSTQQVIADAWTHEYEVAKRIHMGTGKDVSMQAEASDIECGNCDANPFSACKCDAPWKSLIHSTPLEMSHVARGAYDATKVIQSGFYAALEQEVKHMTEIEALEARLAAMERHLAEEKDLLPDTPAPTSTDNGDKKKIPSTSGDPVPDNVDDPTEKAAEEDEKDKKIKDLEAKCKAMEDDKMNKENEAKKASAGIPAPIQTSASFQSRRSDPAPTQTFKAQDNSSKGLSLTFEQFQASRSEGKDPFEHAPKNPTSPNTKYTEEARKRGYTGANVELQADIVALSAMMDTRNTIQIRGS